MVSSTESKDATLPPGAGSEAKRPRYSNILDDLDLDPDDDIKDYKRWVAESLWPAFRSAPLIHLIEYGLPKEQRWIFYLLLVQFHEDFCLRLCLYCLVPTCMMWYFPELCPILVLTATRCINEVMQGKHKTTRNKFRMFLSCLLYADRVIK